MKTQILVRLLAVLVFVSTMVSCVAPQQQRMMMPPMGAPMMPGGGPMMMGGSPVMMQRGSPPTMQRGGGSYHHSGTRMGPPSTAGLPGERRGDWNLDGVLHERWKYNAATGQITKVDEHQYSPEDPALEARMRKSGVVMFPDRVPVGGTLPKERRSENRPEE